MIFTSPIFLFLFLPAVLLIYFTSKQQWRNVLLLVISIFFYACGEDYYVLIIMISILFNYFFARRISYYNNTDTTAGVQKRKAITILAIIANLGMLIFIKYTHFIVSILSFDTITIPKYHLPIGISFFTFKALSYIIDVYRKKIVADNNIVNVGLYISLFPQLMAGPISRYPDVSDQFKERKIDSGTLAGGIQRFIIGLGKKVLIADTIAPVVDEIFKVNVHDLTMSAAWLGAIGYTIQLYFDFSGYTDMAIGLGRMFGFRFMENFNYPYMSKSIRDFWQRWHISLSTWFKDYLYIPLGGNRVGPARMYINLLIVFFLCGLWHGASWCFAIWGLWHGTFLIIERSKPGKIYLFPMVSTPARICDPHYHAGMGFFPLRIADIRRSIHQNHGRAVARERPLLCRNVHR